MPRKLSEEQQRLIIEKYEAGLTLRQIASAFGVSAMTIKRVLVDHAVPRRSPGRRASFPTKRRCTMCKRMKPIEAFEREARRPSGYGYTCKACRRREAKRHSITKYGVSIDEFEELKRKQGGGCAVCGRKFGHERGRGGQETRLVIDHEHSTGEVRGLLCSRCNTAIGLFEDSVDLLKAAIEYLSDET